MKSVLSPTSVLLAVALCTSLQASEGDTKRNVADIQIQTEEFRDLSAITDKDLWNNSELRRQRTQWIANLQEPSKSDENLTDAEKMCIKKAERLPEPLHLLVFDFVHGSKKYRDDRAKLKFIGQNMQKCIPSLMHWNGLFNGLDAALVFCAAGQQQSTPRCIFKSNSNGYSYSNELESQPAIFQGPSIALNKNSFMAGRLANRPIVFFRVPGCQLKRLLETNLKDLKFGVELFDRQKKQAKRAEKIVSKQLDLIRLDNPGQWLDGLITPEEGQHLAAVIRKSLTVELTPPEKNLLDQLEKNNPAMAENLKSNYCKEITSL